MASLDQMEGEGLELAALLVIVVLIVAIVLFYMGSKGLLNWLLKLLQELVAWLKKLLDGKGGGKTFLGAGNSNSGTPQVQDSNLLFQIPSIPIAKVPGLDGNLYPLRNVDIPGIGTGASDLGSGTGVSIDGGEFVSYVPDGGS